jgi:hypothetical protein
MIDRQMPPATVIAFGLGVPQIKAAMDSIHSIVQIGTPQDFDSFIAGQGQRGGRAGQARRHEDRLNEIPHRICPGGIP